MMCLKKSMQCASRSCVTDYRDAVATSIRIVLLYIGFAIIAKRSLADLEGKCVVQCCDNCKILSYILFNY